MKKNVASQIIGAEMLDATDGSAFTGAVTCYFTIDGGSQIIGSVDSGICTHEGNGFHSYTPIAGETNGNHIGWTFIGTGAVPVTIQVYPTFPQSGDVAIVATEARLAELDAGNLPADIAALPTVAEIWTNATRTLTSFGTLSIDLARVLGLVVENLVEEVTSRDSNGNKLTSTIYIYDSAANATIHDKVTGLDASYNISASYTNNLMDLFKSIKAS